MGTDSLSHIIFMVALVAYFNVKTTLDEAAGRRQTKSSRHSGLCCELLTSNSTTGVTVVFQSMDTQSQCDGCITCVQLCQSELIVRVFVLPVDCTTNTTCITRVLLWIML